MAGIVGVMQKRTRPVHDRVPGFSILKVGVGSDRFNISKLHRFTTPKLQRGIISSIGTGIWVEDVEVIIYFYSTAYKYT